MRSLSMPVATLVTVLTCAASHAHTHVAPLALKLDRLVNTQWPDSLAQRHSNVAPLALKFDRLINTQRPDRLAEPHFYVAPRALKFDRLANTQRPDSLAELHCLALNVYHEARGEDMAGRLAVAEVTLNRARSPRFPSTICEVVWQRGQFSWTRDGRNDWPLESKAWTAAIEVAIRAYWYSEPSPVGDAAYYHHESVSPPWARNRRVVAKIGKHLFYAL